MRALLYIVFIKKKFTRLPVLNRRREEAKIGPYAPYFKGYTRITKERTKSNDVER